MVLTPLRSQALRLEGVIPQEEEMAAEPTERGRAGKNTDVHYHLLLCAKYDASMVGMEIGQIHVAAVSPFLEIRALVVPVLT